MVQYATGINQNFKENIGMWNKEGQKYGLEANAKKTNTNNDASKR